jgi:hypothetical protein
MDEAQSLQNRSVWVRKFELPTEDSKPSFLAQRRALFIQVFQDENDPYTHRKIEKSRCLKKVEPDRVFFLSGSDRNWSGCTQKNAVVADSVRQWFFCGLQVYELTAKNISSTDLFSLNCPP